MINKYSILVIEDERHISNFICRVLDSHDYRSIQAFSGTEGLSIITSQCPDIILLDLGLPDIDGLSVISQVRTWSNSPIIVVSARTNEIDKVKALDLGADDYITKPVSTPELLARIRASIRHSNKLSSDSVLHSYISDGLTIDFERRMVLVNNNIIHLTPVEYRIMSYLAQNSGKVITHTALLTTIWGPYSDVDDNKILRVNIAHIRRKIEENPADPKYLFTEVGVGYRLREEQPSISI